MTGLQKIFDDINKKYSELKKDRNKLLKDFDAFKQATALQLKNWSVGMEKMSKTMQIMSKGINERFIVLEKKPCMSIATTFTEKQAKKLLKLAK